MYEAKSEYVNEPNNQSTGTLANQSITQCATVKSGCVIHDGMKEGFFMMYFRSCQNSSIIKTLIKLN